MARVAGVEPAAPSFGGSCSIQLSYTRATAGVPNMTPTVRLRIEGMQVGAGERLDTDVALSAPHEPKASKNGASFLPASWNFLVQFIASWGVARDG